MDYLQKKQLSVTELSFRQVCRMLIQEKEKYDCIVLNPQTTNMRVPRPVAEVIVNPPKPPQTEKLQIGVIPKVPEELVEAVQKLGNAHSKIHQIFLQLLIRGNEKSFLLVVDAEREFQEKGLSGLQDEFKEASGGAAAGVATYSGQMKVILDQHAVEPVYKRKV